MCGWHSQSACSQVSVVESAYNFEDSLCHLWVHFTDGDIIWDQEKDDFTYYSSFLCFIPPSGSPKEPPGRIFLSQLKAPMVTGQALVMMMGGRQQHQLSSLRQVITWRRGLIEKQVPLKGLCHEILAGQIWYLKKDLEKLQQR